MYYQKFDWFFTKRTFPIQEKLGVHFSVKSMNGYSIIFNPFVLELTKKNRTKILYKVHWKAPLSEFVFKACTRLYFKKTPVGALSVNSAKFFRRLCYKTPVTGYFFLTKIYLKSFTH